MTAGQPAFTLQDGAVFQDGNLVGWLVALKYVDTTGTTQVVDPLAGSTFAEQSDDVTKVDAQTSQKSSQKSKKSTGRHNPGQGTLLEPLKEEGSSNRSGDTAKGSGRSGSSTEGSSVSAKEESMVGEGRSGGKPLGSDADDFLDWLAHHHELTGIGIPGAKTKRFKELRVRYWAIRKQEDFTADDLKLATVGAFADQWRRDNGYVGHWNILRFKAVPQLIEKGRGTGTGNMTMRGREQAAVSLRRTPKQQAVALWTTEVFALCNDATTGPDSLDEIDPAMPFKPKTKAEARAKLADYGLDVDTLLADYTKHRRNGGFPDRDAWVLTTTGRSTAP